MNRILFISAFLTIAIAQANIVPFITSQRVFEATVKLKTLDQSEVARSRREQDKAVERCQVFREKLIEKNGPAEW
jgi:hypothetical protein